MRYNGNAFEISKSIHETESYGLGSGKNIFEISIELKGGM